MRRYALILGAYAVEYIIGFALVVVWIWLSAQLWRITSLVVSVPTICVAFLATAFVIRLMFHIVDGWLGLPRTKAPWENNGE